jgi:hypothetical protein
MRELFPHSLITATAMSIRENNSKALSLFLRGKYKKRELFFIDQDCPGNKTQKPRSPGNHSTKKINKKLTQTNLSL